MGKDEMRMTSSRKMWLACVALCGTLAACSEEQSGEAVAMEQFKTACKGGNLQACNGILQYENMHRADAAQASAQLSGARTTGY
ncbi:hypothetical protein D2T29_19985 [Sinirhodobacter populi]|uniref:Lipoprotein n=2 Tax=Paenirhodobacter populi TaxID=2306993 RepID=A0A443K221_9RHOB|nr:hypothetical protein D2T29_19985 [Sinirhodobacter populi]